MTSRMIATLIDDIDKLKLTTDELRRDHETMRNAMDQLINVQNAQKESASSSDQNNPIHECENNNITCGLMQQEKLPFCFGNECFVNCGCPAIHADQLSNDNVYAFVETLYAFTKYEEARKYLHYAVNRGDMTKWVKVNKMITMHNVIIWLEDLNPELALADVKLFHGVRNN